ncbi:MAG: hypothetical protein KJI69_00400 [Patescibacteria group bacterium]|nr:hypothetical protein [Patescibacteria group bacterium]
MELIGFTLDIIGKVMIAFTALMVHHRFSKEHKIDEKVFSEMKREKIVGILGILFMILGFLLQLSSKL